MLRRCCTSAVASFFVLLTSPNTHVVLATRFLESAPPLAEVETDFFSDRRSVQSQATRTSLLSLSRSVPTREESIPPATLRAAFTALKTQSQGGEAGASSNFVGSFLFGLDLETVALSVVLFALSSLVAVQLQQGGRKQEKLEEKNSQRDALQAACKATVTEMEAVLGSLSESFARLAERNFEANRRAFVRFLQRVERDPHRFYGRSRTRALTEPPPSPASVSTGRKGSYTAEEELLMHFRRFVQLWLRVFSQCSIDAGRNRKSILSKQELARCTTIARTCELVQQRLGSQKVDLIAQSVQEFQLELPCQVRSKISEGFHSRKADQAGPTQVRSNCTWLACELGCGARSRGLIDESPYPVDCWCGLVRLTMFSPWHVLLLFGMVVAPFLAAFEYSNGKFIASALSCLALVCLVLCLLNVESLDELARLDRELRELEDEGEAMHRSRARINKFYANLQQITNLWRYRTVPQLENLKEIYEQLWDTSDQEKLVFLAGVCDRLEIVDGQMGSVDLWCGESSLPETILSGIADQLTDCTSFIEKHHNHEQATRLIHERLTRVFGFLTVRVIAAHNLVSWDSGMTGIFTSSYVIIQAGGKLFRTSTVDSLDPEWNGEEFFNAVSPICNTVDISVFCDNGSMMRHSLLGCLTIDFRSLSSGKWHAYREALSGHTTQDGGAELDFEIYFATEAQHMDWAFSSIATTDLRLSAFMECY